MAYSIYIFYDSFCCWMLNRSFLIASIYSVVYSVWCFYSRQNDIDSRWPTGFITVFYCFNWFYQRNPVLARDDYLTWNFSTIQIDSFDLFMFGNEFREEKIEVLTCEHLLNMYNYFYLNRWILAFMAHLLWFAYFDLPKAILSKKTNK